MEKMRTKRSLLTDENGLSLAVVLDGANRHDVKLLEAMLDSIVVSRPEVTSEVPQNLCLDAGYTGSEQAVGSIVYITHICSRREEK